MTLQAAPTTPPRPAPAVRTITTHDISEALAAGLRDFQAAPQYGLFFGGVYALAGLAIVTSLIVYGISYLAYPLAAGFALIGPFIAVGLYEVSRRREMGLPLSWRAVLGVIADQGSREIAWMAFVTLFVFIVWMYQVRLLLALFLGSSAFGSLNEFLTVLLTTPEGLTFLVIGNVIGALLALGLFSLTVVSFPLLLDRDIDFITAMITSVQAVVRNPLVMIYWGIIIAIELAFSAIPMFLGLIISLPLIGHASWHLYRRVVEPEPEEPSI
ncbi:MAG: DUF2189 domain-containing protein [Xanthobacteraceae bacterium]|nr:MAG: DUF2189 domain-containing protein [Xanthobacteraceae bacterium]